MEWDVAESNGRLLFGVVCRGRSGQNEGHHPGVTAQQQQQFSTTGTGATTATTSAAAAAAAAAGDEECGNAALAVAGSFAYEL